MTRDSQETFVVIGKFFFGNQSWDEDEDVMED